jgi:glycine amidinotransferase
MDQWTAEIEFSAGAAAADPAGTCPVNSWNEWDPLEEVIVGRPEGAIIPPRHISVTFNMPPLASRLHRLAAGIRYPGWMVRRARSELNGLVRLLEAEGVTVRHPDPVNHRSRCRTRFWSSRGFGSACPRDGFLVIGDEIIEAPMCWRSRYFEGDAYRRLFKEYAAAGARWTAAPRPQLTDALYDERYRPPAPGEAPRFVVTEFEPVFDAADFVRCGRDLFVTRSNVTNLAGINWLRRHLAARGVRVHEIVSTCRTPMHIDSTFVPLAPGRVLVNPDYVDVGRLPPVLRRWEVLVAPRPDPVNDPLARISMCSPWISINVLMLDERRVVVEASQKTLHRALRDWGFEPMPLPFLAYGPFGGSFHCATLDVRRRGTLRDYCA